MHAAQGHLWLHALLATITARHTSNPNPGTPQAQMERLAADKAAASLKFERDLAAAREEASKAAKTVSGATALHIGGDYAVSSGAVLRHG